MNWHEHVPAVADQELLLVLAATDLEQSQELLIVWSWDKNWSALGVMVLVKCDVHDVTEQVKYDQG